VTLKIVILEDNVDRQREMRKYLRDRFYTFDHEVFSNPGDCLRYLQNHLTETTLISLDHDMELIAGDDGRLHDPGTGREVAEWLAQSKPVCPVVFHSTNNTAVDAMTALLKEKGWRTFAVRPWGDLEWIGAQWYPTVRQALLETAVQPAPAPHRLKRR
jgi:CheY-like chemotaxis protein